MKPILDATAGNRMMWKNKMPPDVIFMDKETRLRIPPHVFATWEKLPFRDNAFSLIIFDPPHYAGFGKNSIHKDPSGESWLGEFGNKRKLMRAIVNASKEFSRTSKRLCLKWCESYWGYFEKTTGRYRKRNETPTLWKVLGALYSWREVFRLERKSKYGNSNQKLYWVTLENKSMIV